jgi:hypothetical protein
VASARPAASINTTDRDLLTALFAANGWSESDASSMAARIIDWRDSDDESKEGGAESRECQTARRGRHHGESGTVRRARDRPRERATPRGSYILTIIFKKKLAEPSKIKKFLVCGRKNDPRRL